MPSISIFITTLGVAMPSASSSSDESSTGAGAGGRARPSTTRLTHAARSMARTVTLTRSPRRMDEWKTEAPHSCTARPSLVAFCKWKETVPSCAAAAVRVRKATRMPWRRCCRSICSSAAAWFGFASMPMLHTLARRAAFVWPTAGDSSARGLCRCRKLPVAPTDALYA